MMLGRIGSIYRKWHSKSRPLSQITMNIMVFIKIWHETKGYSETGKPKYYEKKIEDYQNSSSTQCYKQNIAIDKQDETLLKTRTAFLSVISNNNVNQNNFIGNLNTTCYCIGLSHNPSLKESDEDSMFKLTLMRQNLSSYLGLANFPFGRFVLLCHDTCIQSK